MSTSAAEVLEAGRGRSPAGVVEMSATGKDSRAGELLTGLVGEMLALGGDVGSSSIGETPELEVCFGARGALKGKKTS
jgi:hypothetical protein